ncbi:hypothetical protein [Salicibibacter halophilus]|uniref:hypothetical protein n=1 Tax=Salicibibacter halophilus TaxID=2502791 RepID=UPI001358BFF8|nr:hypothetical protein [Salicibibacter halophilus]
MEYDRKNAPDSLAGAFTIALGRHGGLSIYEFDRDIEIDQGKAYSLANQYWFYHKSRDG